MFDEIMSAILSISIEISVCILALRSGPIRIKCYSYVVFFFCCFFLLCIYWFSNNKVNEVKKKI